MIDKKVNEENVQHKKLRYRTWNDFLMWNWWEKVILFAQRTQKSVQFYIVAATTNRLNEKRSKTDSALFSAISWGPKHFLLMEPNEFQLINVVSLIQHSRLLNMQSVKWNFMKWKNVEQNSSLNSLSFQHYCLKIYAHTHKNNENDQKIPSNSTLGGWGKREKQSLNDDSDEIEC